MEISVRGIDLIKEFEGYRDTSYQDIVGVWTIGYGTTKPGGCKVTPGMRCTEEQAVKWIMEEVEPVSEKITDLVSVSLNQNQFDALVDFTYNLGVGAFSKSSLLKKLNAGDYEGAANEFLRWNKAGGVPVAGLTRRRQREKDLFLSEEV